jgi:hypothetical protein
MDLVDEPVERKGRPLMRSKADKGVRQAGHRNLEFVPGRVGCLNVAVDVCVVKANSKTFKYRSATDGSLKISRLLALT